MSKPLCRFFSQASGMLRLLIARHHHNVSIGAHQGASLASREKRAESAVFSRHGCISLPEPDLTPIEWLWGDGPWPPLSSCYRLFAGVYRGRLERGVIAAVQSPCGVVIYIVNSLANNIDTICLDLTRTWSPSDPRSTSCSDITPVIVQQRDSTSCRSSDASHRIRSDSSMAEL